ncbi:uncharacterized protein Dwil_GK23806, isoform B [Drosophila willistoni]|uniref:Uncharacterized protein, isoform B n=1 Tax=Drosophila willistoni TaxID=7260 RepID=A0A0Q9WPW7_DROWI|nr:uncharacterized protein LOC6641697 isoform X4 [Drosophila willistoni]KRF98244.1 uncharacterized protein Dwil_GK23806, isoform B [Drosophila willistoni]
MDVWGFCVSDSTLSYGGSMRGGYYRDFEQFPYGTLEPSTTPFVVKDSYSRVQVPSNGTTNSKLSKTKSQNCKCEPSTCKCSSKRRQQQQYQRLILSQLRRRGADNISSVILF